MKRLLLVTVILTGCDRAVDVAREKERILQTDRDFAALSVRGGGGVQAILAGRRRPAASRRGTRAWPRECVQRFRGIR
jgi:hypothetical protein